MAKTVIQIFCMGCLSILVHELRVWHKSHMLFLLGQSNVSE